ncbi:acyl-CoA dehydrogenase family protein [Sinirhodobacter huangdaonensis]|uniref:Acyl-CoA dehydrogenase n=1 Tax=Paenirhodobacter huangdaonensis TaxID=2501515 RepID=A0A3S3MSU1_9RHOB|nr:acyl-CoA dehydrogenase family protein [Sinirhodobacter huangdaonensis]RWR54544.1 acyl-CoA dehydrogenase [Sinirhodobacter huangdaonensis]
MTPFSAPVDDILFTLEHVAGASRLPGWDGDLAREIVAQFGRLAAAEIAPADEAGDLEGCRLENGRVVMPAGLRAAYGSFVAQGWHALALPEESGGQGMPAALAGAVTEIFAAASHALQMVVGLVPGAARTIARFGTEAQRALWLPRLASGEWLATMALTEPGAGSDLSGVRTQAVLRDGHWQIDGEKIFISGGDQDLTPHILHLVLARSGTAQSGVKGLSLFLVPSHGEDGQRLPVTVSRIEEKMGLHGSPTCQMLFDAAPAQLLGREGDGLREMFTMMNHARLDVSLQGVGHAARAAAIARSYAATRRQGRSGLALDAHADVRRMLDEAETIALGLRALVQMALVEMDLDESAPLLDFLTPVCKFAGTEGGVAAADLAIQVLGGYGYLREYRVEQILRDARIAPIYEGANGIHAMTLAGRLLRHDEGAAAQAFADWLAPVPATQAAWQAARHRMLATEDPGAGATAFMRLTVAAASSRVWACLAAAAQHAPDPDRLRHLAARAAAQLPAQIRHHAEMLEIELG